jgi:hypothetical protein
MMWNKKPWQKMSFFDGVVYWQGLGLSLWRWGVQYFFVLYNQCARLRSWNRYVNLGRLGYYLPTYLPTYLSFYDLLRPTYYLPSYKKNILYNNLEKNYFNLSRNLTDQIVYYSTSKKDHHNQHVQINMFGLIGWHFVHLFKFVIFY